jgi:hypothetical protein
MRVIELGYNMGLLSIAPPSDENIEVAFEEAVEDRQEINVLESSNEVIFLDYREWGGRPELKTA